MLRRRNRVGMSPRRHSWLAVPFVAAARAIRGWLAIANGIASAPLRWLAKLLLLACFPFALRFIFWPLVVWVVENMFGLARHEKLKAFAGHPVGQAASRLRSAGTGVAQHVVAAGRSIDWIPIGIGALAVLALVVLGASLSQLGRRRNLLHSGTIEQQRNIAKTRSTSHRVASYAALLLGAAAGALATWAPVGAWWIWAALAAAIPAIALVSAMAIGRMDPVSGEPAWAISWGLVSGTQESGLAAEARNKRWHRLVIGTLAAGVLSAVACSVLRIPGGDLGFVAGGIAIISLEWSTAARIAATHRQWASRLLAASGGERIAAIRTWMSSNGQERVEATFSANVLADDVAKRATVLRESLAQDEPEWTVQHDGLSQTILISHVGPDPLAAAVPWPYDPDEVEGTIRSLPLGVNADGEQVRVPILETHYLVGGLPGSGKSGFLNALMASLAPLDHVAIVGLDPKRVEMDAWQDRLSCVVKGRTGVIETLDALLAEMDRRYAYLSDHKMRKFTEMSPEFPLIVVVIDELADLTASGATKDEKGDDDARAAKIRRLAAVGRAAAISVVTATQKPQVDVVPSALRDLLQLRFAFATSTPQMTDTILGQGMYEAGPAHEIPFEAKGTGYIISEQSRVPTRWRAYYVRDEDVPTLAAASAHRRVELAFLPHIVDLENPNRKANPSPSHTPAGKRRPSSAPRQAPRPAEPAPAPTPPAVPGRPARRPHAWLRPEQTPKPAASPAPPSAKPSAPTQRRSAGEPELVEHFEPPLREPEGEEFGFEEWDGEVEDFGRVEPGQPGDETGGNGGDSGRGRGAAVPR